MPHGKETPVEAAPPSQKRKRDGDDAGSQADRIPQPPPPQSGNGTPINYYTKLSVLKLQLLRVHETFFSEILSLMKEYEGVLSRHESLASNLGAKLLGPRLVKALDNMFDGPIIVTPRDPHAPSPIAWFEIVRHLKASPGGHAVTTLPEYGRVCQFVLKGLQVTISESDYRLIMSGAIDRFQFDPDEPLEEDEMAEIATLDILEPRVQGLIMNADEVARKARQLNYHLSGRKAAINLRRSAPQKQAPGFRAANTPARAACPAASYDLHADLIRQFQAQSAQPGAARPPGGTSLPGTPVVQQGAIPRPPSQTPSQPVDISGRPSPIPYNEPALHDVPGDDPHAPCRPFIAARIEKLPRGGAIFPPCDRCRRLKVQCVKHLTACQGCTKKHAKCSWRTITDQDAAWLKGEKPAPVTPGEGEPEGAGGGPSPSGARYGRADPRAAAIDDRSRYAPDTRQEARAREEPSGGRSTPGESRPPCRGPSDPDSTDGRSERTPAALALREPRDRLRDPTHDIIPEGGFALSHGASAAGSVAVDARSIRGSWTPHSTGSSTG